MDATMDASIRQAAEAMREEIISRLSELVNIGSLLDTPEEMKAQVLNPQCPSLQHSGLHESPHDGSWPGSRSLGCLHGGHQVSPWIFSERKQLGYKGYLNFEPFSHDLLELRRWNL